MKKLLIALFLMGLLILPAAAQTAVDPAQDVGKTLQTDKQANLRKQPSKKSMMLDQLPKGTKLTLLSTLQDGDEIWAHVRVQKNGQEGYMLLSLIAPTPTPTPTPSPTPTPTPTPTPSPVPTPTPTPSPTPTPTPIPTPTPLILPASGVEGETAYDEAVLLRTTKQVNLRKTPDGAILAELDAGDQISAMAQVADGEATWLHVVTESGRKGYLLADFTRQIKPAVLIPATESDVREKYPVLSCDPLEDIRKAIPFTYTDEELAKYRTLEPGDSNADVLKLKKRLYEMGYFAKRNDNQQYTDSTADVIRVFQHDVGMEETGVADPWTQALLFDERTPKKQGSENEVKYLSNGDQPLRIQRTDVTSWDFSGAIQLSLRNDSGAKLTAFALKIIPYYTTGEAADMADTFAEEIEREYSVNDIAIADGDSYSDFSTNDRFDEGIWPHHFTVSRKVYFSGAQIAVSQYRSGGINHYVDDDQMVFVEAGCGAGEQLIHTLPIEITPEEVAASKWEMGIVTRYVLPIYQAHYGLVQGAWIKQIERNSPAADAGLEEGDIIVGIGDITILGDATLRKARASIAPGESAELTFWRDGAYYVTEILRPEE